MVGWWGGGVVGVVGVEGDGGVWGGGRVGSGYVSKCDVKIKSVAVFGK